MAFSHSVDGSAGYLVQTTINNHKKRRRKRRKRGGKFTFCLFLDLGLWWGDGLLLSRKGTRYDEALQSENFLLWLIFTVHPSLQHILISTSPPLYNFLCQRNKRSFWLNVKIIYIKSYNSIFSHQLRTSTWNRSEGRALPNMLTQTASLKGAARRRPQAVAWWLWTVVFHA